MKDKIYVHIGRNLGLMQATNIPVTPDEEEYIRKDALLDWINEKRIEFLPGNDDISGVKAHSHLTRSILLDSFEQKINSL